MMLKQKLFQYYPIILVVLCNKYIITNNCNNLYGYFFFLLVVFCRRYRVVKYEVEKEAFRFTVQVLIYCCYSYCYL